MGGECSRSPTKRAGQGKTNPQKKAVPRQTSKGNPAAVAAKGKSPDRQPLCRAIGFATARSSPINSDLGSKGGGASIRSNSYWLHEDDDRVDAVINRWKSSEILLLQVKIVYNHFVGILLKFKLIVNSHSIVGMRSDGQLNIICTGIISRTFANSEAV
jgi:hypothetical protein